MSTVPTLLAFARSVIASPVGGTAPVAAHVIAGRSRPADVANTTLLVATAVNAFFAAEFCDTHTHINKSVQLLLRMRQTWGRNWLYFSVYSIII